MSRRDFSEGGVRAFAFNPQLNQELDLTGHRFVESKEDTREKPNEGLPSAHRTDKFKSRTAELSLADTRPVERRSLACIGHEAPVREVNA